MATEEQVTDADGVTSTATDSEGTTGAGSTTRGQTSSAESSGTIGSEDPTSSGASSATSSTGSASESSTGVTAECGDGAAQPGEFCIAEVSTLSVGCPPQRVQVGDLDGNGRVDLVYAAVDDAELHIFLGGGDGSFVSGPAEALAPRALTLGHYNDDDDLDIAFLDASIQLNVVLNDGNGSLPGSSSGLSVIGNVEVASGDLDNDGYDDVITAGSGGSIGVALSASGGSGALTPTTVGSVGGSALRNGLVIADLNGNADLDFAFTDILNGGRVVACLGDGDGAASSCNGFAVGDLPMGLAAGDIDGDGSTDLVAADSTSNTVTVLIGQGNGGFEDGVAIPVGNAPNRVALADLDLDGHDDLVVTHMGDASVHVLRYDVSRRAFGSAVVFDVPAGAPTDVVVADFNEDGALDIAAGNDTQAELTLLLSDA